MWNLSRQPYKAERRRVVVRCWGREKWRGLGRGAPSQAKAWRSVVITPTVNSTVLYIGSFAKRVDLVLCSHHTHTNKEDKRRLLEVMDILWHYGGDGLMDIYLSPHSSSCVH